MANKYVRSTDGSNSDNGSTWALAKATLAGAVSAAAAGDTIYLSQAHAESNAAHVSLTLPGTRSTPVKVIAANDAAEPPTTTATAILATTGASNISIEGSGLFYGVALNCGNGFNYANIGINTSITVFGRQKYENSAFNLLDTHPSSGISLGSADGFCSTTEFLNCTFKFSSTAQALRLRSNVKIVGGGISSGGSSPNDLIALGSGGALATVHIRDFDFSALSSTFNLFTNPSDGAPGFAQLYNCKMPSGWSGSIAAGIITNPAWRVEMFNCASDDSNYRLWIKDAAGEVVDETTVVMSGGASDGTTSISNKMMTNTNTKIEGAVLNGPDMLVWVSSIGASKTATVEIIHDSATALTDAEVWLDLDYLGTSGFSLGTAANDRIATPLTTPADQSTSSATWTTTGLATPNKQKLAVTFTPQEIGWVRGRVMLAKASKTIYVNPQISVA